MVYFSNIHVEGVTEQGKKIEGKFGQAHLIWYYTHAALARLVARMLDAFDNSSLIVRWFYIEMKNCFHICMYVLCTCMYVHICNLCRG